MLCFGNCGYRLCMWPHNGVLQGPATCVLSPTHELCCDQNTLVHAPHHHVCSFTHAFPCIMHVMMATYSPAAPIQHALPKTICVG